jgi:hypothetical protein
MLTPDMGDFSSTYLACHRMAWRGEKVRETKGFGGMSFATADACKVLKMMCLIFRQQIWRWQANAMTINAAG